MEKPAFCYPQGLWNVDNFSVKKLHKNHASFFLWKSYEQTIFACG